MRLAVPFDHGEIYGHFGRTRAVQALRSDRRADRLDGYCGYDGKRPRRADGILKAYAVDALICGGIGAGARLALEEAGIRLYPGAAGSADEAVRAFLAGTLSYQPDLVCSHHKDTPPRVCGSHTCSAACYHDNRRNPAMNRN